MFQDEDFYTFQVRDWKVKHPVFSVFSYFSCLLIYDDIQDALIYLQNESIYCWLRDWNLVAASRIILKWNFLFYNPTCQYPEYE